MIGPFSTFKVFPATLVNVDWTNYEGSQYPPKTVQDALTQDVTISFSLQYKLQYENIGKIYNQFVDGYQARYASWIESAIKNEI